jgi:predicted amidophosphoribosyltransferase
MRLLLDAIAVLLPVECAGCGSHDRSVCDRCRAAVGPPVRSRVGQLEVASAARYEGVVRELVLSLKEGGRTDAAAALAAAMSPLLAAASDRGSQLALVPSSRAAYRRRGYDPVGLLVARAGLRPRAVLRSARTTAAQKSLDVDARALNSLGSVAAVGDLTGRRFTLVDDVVTTGSTLLEARRAILAAGGEVVDAVTLAATPRYFRDSR